MYTVAARFIEFEARCNYASYELPDGALPRVNTQNVTQGFFASEQKDTRLTAAQMDMLLYHARLATERLEGAIAEVGSYRGVTTRALAEHTKATVYAIDPFAQYGGTDRDFALFRANTVSCNNIVHIKKTSGEAHREFKPGSLCFVFIDATPGFVNVKHDAMNWGGLLGDGGLIAVNNVDNAQFPGSRKAVWELAAGTYDLIMHAHDIAVLARRRGA